MLEFLDHTIGWWFSISRLLMSGTKTNNDVADLFLLLVACVASTI